MRIIGGEFKGRNLVPFNGDKIRPTSDMARESFFNIMRDEIYGCNFLDLFCGTGAVGIEALSRGANFVALNDSQKDSLAVVKKNLEKIGNPKAVEVFNKDAKIFIETTNKVFDVIYVDPPYKSGLYESVLKAIAESGVLSEKGVVAVETETPYEGETFGLVKTDERKYGRVRITFFKKEKL
ncbi:MAG: 16S rRNA (guanine(966)-N(2))-methyltransferase RsmD [Clostridia bacterium]|nr:16S rRNA (guanine(966)-N(2))-methyltransferase RsmD [Clostridia bacterium]